MRIVYEVCCGLDVHKRSVTACLLRKGARGKQTKEVRTYETMTADLQQLADWLEQNGCQHVAMESTGVYWKPVYNILEARGHEVLLVNAQHIKNVPGRKTDVKDSEWIAELLLHGLLRGSFVPPQAIRELRDLTRYRKKLIGQRASECNRLQKLLECCNIKLASVATDVLGRSGREMLAALAAGESDPKQMANLARSRLRSKIPQLVKALEGNVSDTQRWLLRLHLEQIHHFDRLIEELDVKVEELTLPFADLIQKLIQIPGVSRRIAEVIIAEIGVDMKQFASSAHLASWAGMCPGNRESAGKRQSGRTRHGSPWLKAALVEGGWAASHTKGTALSARYHHLVRRRGKKRACVAVGHSILTIAYHLLAEEDIEYWDLGPDYLDKVDRERLKHNLLRRLRALGVKVTIEKDAA